MRSPGKFGKTLLFDALDWFGWEEGLKETLKDTIQLILSLQHVFYLY